MINTRNTKPGGSHPKLVSIVEALINTKIECLEQQQDFLHSSFEELDQLDVQSLNQIQSERRLRSIKCKFDEFIEKVDQLIYARDLLLLIKTFLKEDTAKAIFELLTNDKYLFYTPESLKRLLGLESYLQGHFAMVTDN